MLSLKRSLMINIRNRDMNKHPAELNTLSNNGTRGFNQ